MEATRRLDVLDGWRGISILAVLACHLLPLGTHTFNVNEATGIFGMAIFFCLSGFLITSFLLRHASVTDFLIRRLCRIVPLAWVALAIGLWMAKAGITTYVPNFLFYANWPPFWLTEVTGHFWSLCVEVQFYGAVALLFGLFGRRGLLLGIPAACVVVTGYRIAMGKYASIETYFRVDEILAGGILALAYAGELGTLPKRMLGGMRPLLCLLLFAAATHPFFGPLDYLRPYFAAGLVGVTLMGRESYFNPVLRSRVLAYIAEISYALYVIHPLLGHTWLGSGGAVAKYAKRPLLFIVLFAVSHASTYWYEHRWIDWGKRLSARWLAKRQPAVASVS
jgi:peptidoglycan/LPS O-acetylase OafA/YrhL